MLGSEAIPQGVGGYISDRYYLALSAEDNVLGAENTGWTDDSGSGQRISAWVAENIDQCAGYTI